MEHDEDSGKRSANQSASHRNGQPVTEIGPSLARNGQDGVRDPGA